jgi:WhiB family transcriptional regulator, redox-sensing transcriptional regulator
VIQILAWRPEMPGERISRPDDLSWRDGGRCGEVDPEVFFPATGQHTDPARRICAGCEVRVQCLEFALGSDEAWGIWGGTDEDERRRIRASRDRSRNGLAA